jgi:hypothetical protein
MRLPVQVSVALSNVRVIPEGITIIDAVPVLPPSWQVGGDALFQLMLLVRVHVWLQVYVDEKSRNSITMNFIMVAIRGSLLFLFITISTGFGGIG